MSIHIKSKSYTLKDENGQWLGQIVLTQNGMFAGVTDYGNLSFSWGSTGEEDFRIFINRLDIEYFAGKLQNGLSYIVFNNATKKACKRFAEKILPALQLELKKEINNNIPW